MAAFSWKSRLGGDWATGADWKTGVVPGALDTATIGAPGTYIVTVSSPETIAALKLTAAGATLLVTSTLTVNGRLDLTSGTLDLGNSAELANATINVGAAGHVMLGNYTTLSATTWHGLLDLSDFNKYVSIQNGLSVTAANGTGKGTIELTGGNTQLAFQGGTQTLDNAVVHIGGTDTQYTSYLLLDYSASAEQLILGSHLLIDQTGTLAAIQTNTALGTITNRGVIQSALAGGTLTITGAGTFLNTGTLIVANGGTMIEQSASFSSTGKIIETNGVLKFAGSLTTAGLGTVARTGGTVILSGTLDNSGSKLNLGAGSALGAVQLSGTILSGIVHDAGGGLVVQGGTLSGVTYESALGMTFGDYAGLTVQNGLIVTGITGTGRGTLNLTGISDTLTLSGTVAQSLDNTTVAIGNTSNADVIALYGTATLGSQFVLTHAGLYAQVTVAGLLTNYGRLQAGVAGGLFTVTGQSGTFVNAGVITVSNGDTLQLLTDSVVNTGAITVTSGGVLSLGNAAGTLTNTGMVSLAGGQINLGGSAITVAQIAAIKRTGGTLNIAGSLDLGTATMNVGAGTSLGRLQLSGTVANGIIHDAGHGLLFQATPYAPAILSNIEYRGVLDLSESGAYVVAQGAFGVTGINGTGTGVIKLTGAGSGLTLVGSQTLDNLAIAIGGTPLIPAIGNATATLASTPVNSATPVTLALGAHVAITQTGSLAALTSSYYTGDVIISRGSITAGISGGSFTVSGGTLFNVGVISVSNGDTFSAITNLVNSGTIAVTTGGTLSLNGPWTNTGVIRENAGTVLLYSTLTVAQLGQIQRVGGSVVIAGSLALAGSTLNVGAGSTLGRFVVTGSISGGTVHDGGSGLVFGSATVGNLTYQGTLTIGAVQSGTSTVGGTVLDTGNLTLTGTAGHGPGAIVLNGGSLATALLFRGTQTIDNVAITMGGTSAAVGMSDPYNTPSVVTLGAHTTLTQAANYATLSANGFNSFQYYSGDGIIIDGTINAGVRHGSFYMFGPTITNNGIINVSNGDHLYIDPNTFTNTGTIAVTSGGVVQLGYGNATNTGKISETNATLLLYGSLTVAQLGRISRSGGVVQIGGSLDLGGGTLSVGIGSALGSLSVTGIVANGIIHDAGNGMQFYGQYLGQGGTLDSIAYRGVLDLTTSYSSVTVQNGLTLTGAAGTGTGAVALTGAGSKLTFDDSQSFDKATITIGNTALQSTLAFTDTSFDGETLTLGAQVLLTARAGVSQIQSTRALGDTILNRGTVLAAAAGATLSVFGGTFENAGLVSVGTGAAMFLEPDLLVNDAGGVIRTGAGGRLVIGAAAGVGAFQIQQGGTMDFTDGVAATVSATFLGKTGVLQLDAPASFAGGIAGLAVGDIIDFTNASVSAPMVKAGKLSVKVNGVALSFTVKGALTDTHFAVRSDGAGGTDLVLTAGAAAVHDAVAAMQDSAPPSFPGAAASAPAAADWGGGHASFLDPTSADAHALPWHS